MSDDRTMKLRLTAAGVALALALGACSSKEDTMTDTIREGLPDDSTIARVIDEQPTEAQVLDLPALEGWRLAEVRATGERPHAWVVGYRTSGDPSTVVLTGNPDRWSQVTAGASVEDEAGAIAVARAWYDATRRTDELWYRAESVDDIDWQPVVDEEAVARLQEEYRDTLTAPTATRDGDGWTVTLWSVQQRDLVRHDLRIGADASVHDEAETVEQAMPVSEAV
ncbi:hypothetical protein JAAN108728_01705 [Janibacter anophelis]